MKNLLLVASLVCLASFASVAHAQAVCEGVTGNGRCNNSNSFGFQPPIANTDQSVFNDYASTEVIFSSSSPACSNGQPTAAATVKNVGAVGVPQIPLANSPASIPMSVVGMPNGKVFASVRVADIAGNRSACASPEVSFNFDNLPPAIPTGVSVK